MLMIVVSRRRQTIIDKDGLQARGRLAFVRKGERLRILQACESFEDVTSVRLVMKTWRKLVRFPRSEKVEKGIAVALRRHHAKVHQWFDCHAFACLVHGLSPYQKVWHKEWNAVDCKVSEPGDVVFFLSNDRSLFRHAAVYLGMGMYVSVWGAGGPLAFMTLDDLQKFYRNAEVVHFAPRNSKIA